MDSKYYNFNEKTDFIYITYKFLVPKNKTHTLCLGVCPIIGGVSTIYIKTTNESKTKKFSYVYTLN